MQQRNIVLQLVVGPTIIFYNLTSLLVQKIDLKILMNLHILRHAGSNKLIFGMSSVCLSVDTITQKTIKLAQPNNDMRSYMIKI